MISADTHSDPNMIAPENRAAEIGQRLRQAHPDAHCALNYASPIQLLVATILSAQCTDERVNRVTPQLFARYPDAASLATADRDELEAIIHPTGFFRQKARFIQASCLTIVQQHDGRVPDNMADLLQLVGVARKTANVVLGEIYGLAYGITVDTHVKRLAKRLGLTDSSNPGRVETDLMALYPQTDWIQLSHLLIFHGRRVCDARRPNCSACVLNDLCPTAVI